MWHTAMLVVARNRLRSSEKLSKFLSFMYVSIHYILTVLLAVWKLSTESQSVFPSRFFPVSFPCLFSQSVFPVCFPSLLFPACLWLLVSLLPNFEVLSCDVLLAMHFPYLSFVLYCIVLLVMTELQWITSAVMTFINFVNHKLVGT